ARQRVVPARCTVASDPPVPQSGEGPTCPAPGVGLQTIPESMRQAAHRLWYSGAGSGGTLPIPRGYVNRMREVVEVVRRRGIGEWTFRGTGEDLPGRGEPRSVTGTVPRAFGCIPAHDASHVRADAGAARDDALLVTIDRELGAVLLDDGPLPTRHGPKRCSRCSGKPIANQVVGIVGVLGEVVPESLRERLAAGVEQIGPGIGPADDRV